MTEYNNIAVHTPTVEDFIEVVEYFLDCGLEWRSTGRRLNDHHWNNYKQNTCVTIELNKITYGCCRPGKKMITVDRLLGNTERTREILKQFI